MEQVIKSPLDEQRARFRKDYTYVTILTHNPNTWPELLSIKHLASIFECTERAAARWVENNPQVLFEPERQRYKKISKQKLLKTLRGKA